MPNYPKHKESGAGFTLIEVLVILGILGLLASLGLFLSMDVYRGNSLSSERNIIISVLQKARSRAINNMCLSSSCTDGQKFGVHFEADDSKYVIFQGLDYNSSPYKEEIIASKNITNSGISEIIFERLSGETATAQNLVVTDGSKSFTISINQTGRISWD